MVVTSPCLLPIIAQPYDEFYILCKINEYVTEGVVTGCL